MVLRSETRSLDSLESGNYECANTTVTFGSKTIVIDGFLKKARNSSGFAYVEIFTFNSYYVLVKWGTTWKYKLISTLDDA